MGKKTVFDSSGNEFKVTGFTKDLRGAVNGFYLKGARGDKEVSLSEYKYYTQKKRK